VFKKLAISSVAGLTAASLMMSAAPAPAQADSGGNKGIQVIAPITVQAIFCHISVFIGLKMSDDCRRAAGGEIIQPKQIKTG
jgi:hypothetical protein